MRKHGFRHLRDQDRGATWGNGVVDIFVEKNFAREPGRLRSIMDQIRDAERKKLRLQKQEAEKFASVTARLTEVPKVSEVMTPPQVEVKPEPVIEPESPKDEKRTVHKFKGQERMYVYGRVKAMIAANMTNQAIAEALTAEGIKLPNGGQLKPIFVAQTRLRWEKKPEVAAKYAQILMPRQKAQAPRPVVVAEPPKVPRTRFGLPLTVDAVIADPEVSDDERLQVLLTFLALPESVTVHQFMGDEKLSTRQKIALVEALGTRNRKESEKEDS